MKLLVLPPLRDPTLVTDAPEGWQLADASRAFVARLLGAGELSREAGQSKLQPGASAGMQELLQLRASEQLLAREGASVHTKLRALGAALAGVSGAPSGVQLRLDDLELLDGSTERAADLLRAAESPAPYTPELEQVLTRAAGAERVRLWLEKDQQVPAALTLAMKLPAEVPLELAGPFARTHAAALVAMAPFSRATVVEVPGLEWHVASPFAGESAQQLPWFTEDSDVPAAQRPRDRAWGGHVPLGALAGLELSSGGGHVLVVGIAALTGTAESGAVLVGADGARVPLAVLTPLLTKLAGQQVRVVAEWWVGSPGVDAEAHERTARFLEGPSGFAWVSGVRQFHWTRGRAGADFSGLGVNLLAAPVDRELARTLPFEAPGSIGHGALAGLLAALSARLLKVAATAPGRVALAYVEPARARGTGGLLGLDADCALVQLPAALDGTAKPSWYAANLRTGNVLAVDARLAPLLLPLQRPVPANEALGALPEAQRAKVALALEQKGVLSREHG